MAQHCFLALDLGAESGRGVVGKVTPDRLELNEIHRFANGPVRTGDELHWNVLGLWTEMKRALAMAVEQQGGLSGLGIDTWGVDFGLLDANGSLLANPWNYRDARTNGILDKAFAIVPREEVFEQTGIQFMQFNTIFQLLAMRLAGSPLLGVASTLLTMPDLFNYWLTGRKCCEFTNATTTQAYNPRQGDWARELIERFGLPVEIFPEIVPAGTNFGSLLPEIREETRCGDVPLIAPAQHDTGSAVAAVPARADKSWAFLSSGTWSLIGMEVDAPIIDAQSLRYNFTNEGGVGGTYRFLKNIMGLWLVQECRRTWERQGHAYSYAELSDLAAAAEPFQAILNPDETAFIAPGDMPSRIADFCRKTQQPVPDSPGQFIRLCLEALAMTYRLTLGRIEACTGKSIEVIHMVGGGTKNKVLCQWTADATGRTVITGPVEATAAGNITVQAVACGALPDIWAARDLIRRSFELEVFEPQDTGRWDEPYKRFQALRAD